MQTEPVTECVDLGSFEQLQAEGRLTGKLGALPVLVVVDGVELAAIEDRCPHLGFPLHRGTVHDGMITCHWHHARFDLASGCALDPWADDAAAFDASVDADGRVVVSSRRPVDPLERWQRRLRDGLEHELPLVLAKSVHALVELPGGAQRALSEAFEFGDRNRAEGWGSGMTVVTCMANLLPHLQAGDQPAALIHALTFLARDVRGHAPRFGQPPMVAAGQTSDRLMGWYRAFVETRNTDGAERALATAVEGGDLATIERSMFATLTDHVYVDGGHSLDFTNKAFEAVGHVGSRHAAMLTSLVMQTCQAERSEETSEWQHPHDLVTLGDSAKRHLAELDLVDAIGGIDVARLGWALLSDDPAEVVTALLAAADDGAALEELARAVAFAGALRLVRFHTNNDPGDWDTVHHTFTFANAVHQAVVRRPSPAIVRGIVDGALRVYLDRFLNVPAARLPGATKATETISETTTATTTTARLDDLAACWNIQGAVDQAGIAVWGALGAGTSRSDVIVALGHALLQEDAGFHWYQSIEAGVRQALAWPEGSDEAALVLVGVARFLAAHTPTRRELATITRTAVRLRRGESTFEDDT